MLCAIWNSKYTLYTTASYVLRTTLSNRYSMTGREKIEATSGTQTAMKLCKKIILPYAYIHKSCISLLFLLHLFIHSSSLGELCFVGLSLLCMCSLYISYISYTYMQCICMYIYGTWYDIKVYFSHKNACPPHF